METTAPKTRSQPIMDLIDLLLAAAEPLWTFHQKYSDKLNQYPRGAGGLTPDDVKNSAEYQRDLRRFRNAHAALREFHKKRTKKELRQMRDRRRELARTI